MPFSLFTFVIFYIPLLLLFWYWFSFLWYWLSFLWWGIRKNSQISYDWQEWYHSYARCISEVDLTWRSSLLYELPLSSHGTATGGHDCQRITLPERCIFTFYLIITVLSFQSSRESVRVLSLCPSYVNRMSNPWHRMSYFLILIK
jgi:hypothetical protein